MTINERYAANMKAEVLAQIPLAEKPAERTEKPNPEPKAYFGTFGGYGNGSIYSNTGPVPIINGVFNGEKTAGEMGNPMNLLPDYRALRFRAYETYLTNDGVKSVAGKYFKWIVGNGLKMQAEPYDAILKLEKINEDLEAFKANVEPYFELWANSTRSDFSSMGNLHQNAKKQYETKFLGGDCLVICRLDENFNVTTQIIDGQHVNTPFGDSKFVQEATTRGNTILNGVEMDDQGRHVAFYVNKMVINAAATNTVTPSKFEYERVEAYGATTGVLMAWMAYGAKHRIDHVRGISRLSSIVEKAQVLDRFTSATVSGAEERANIYLTVVHGKTSSGEDPLVSGIRSNIGTPVNQSNAFQDGNQVVNKINATTNRTAYNLPVDSELKAVSSQQEINFEPFYTAVFNQICASLDTPPEVAIQKYSSNYSASRAAINSWGFIIDIERNDLVLDFYQPIYNLWLYAHILKNKVSADGYQKARAQNNFDVIESYSAAKFTGPKMPHIDPLKEINAIRTALGDDEIALISHEQATDAYQGGDWETNIKKVAKEKATITRLGLDPAPPEQPAVVPKTLET